MSAKRLTPQQRDEVRARIRNGVRTVDIADEFRVSTSTVDYYIRQMEGVPRPPTPHRPPAPRRPQFAGEAPGYSSATPDVPDWMAKAAAVTVAEHTLTADAARELLLILGLMPLLVERGDAA